MKYNFDKIIDRRFTESTKWDGMTDYFGSNKPLPMWIADMDFMTPKPIIKAVKRRLKHPIYGYSFPGESCYDAIIKKMARDFSWKIKKEWIVFTNGVVDGLDTGIKSLTEPGDSVVIQPPVYFPFTSVIKNNKCEILNNVLLNQNGQYTMNYDDLRSKLSKKPKAIILCSPHNPVGRVWREEELKELGEMCFANNCVMIADEIHNDIVFKSNQHTVLASINTRLEQSTISLFSSSKIFNTPAFHTAFAVIPNPELREKYLQARMGQNGGNLFGYIALEAGYNCGDKYKRKVVKYIEANIEYFVKYINKNIPQLQVVKPEGTYLVWVDMKDLNILPEQRNKFLIQNCRLALDEGGIFGEGGEGFYRFNLACPRVYVEEALLRLEEAIKNL
ncbi:MalY/PatB family protein [Anaeromicropila populeti]|uniref:cysteine-S-conjugate beta-lyase n=1 Tax=Anaeromicropila populeti TaxID=37658 RepID=A0A1I6JMP8_9FIRM|nr:PatB family C-S lyase [Anaeromicropila populeti]SFR80252.1 cystathione beta-lyase [Anaeromicropila populeti]